MYTVEMILDRLDQTLITDTEIVSGDWISAVRFSGANMLRNDILFLSSSTKKNTTLCRTARGSTFSYRDVPENTANQILEIMDYYDTWETSLAQAIHDGCTLTDLLDLAYPAIPFIMFILNNAEWMIACSSRLKNYDLQSNRDLYDLLHFKSSSAEKIASFNKSFHHCFQLREVYKVPGDVFTDNGYAVNLFYENRFCGILLMEGFENKISQGMLDLFFLFSWKIQNMINDPSNNLSFDLKEMSLLNYLNEPNPENLDKLSHDLQITGWKDSDEKQLLYLMPSSDSRLSPNPNHTLLIFNRLPALKAAEYQDGILLLINRSQAKTPHDHAQILDRIRQLSYCAGTGGPFRDISKLPVMLMRSRAALNAGEKTPGAVNNFDDHFMTYLFSSVQKEDRGIIEHPLLKQLEDYDKRYGSSLFHTLFVYLKNERRITATAADMHVSRNTMVHRLQRIEELSGGILDNPLIRLRILLSYYLRDS